ncbi:hypothetical protein Dimus_037582 [Dionaea muscipula]
MTISAHDHERLWFLTHREENAERRKRLTGFPCTGDQFLLDGQMIDVVAFPVLVLVPKKLVRFQLCFVPIQSINKQIKQNTVFGLSISSRTNVSHLICSSFSFTCRL